MKFHDYPLPADTDFEEYDEADLFTYCGPDGGEAIVEAELAQNVAYYTLGRCEAFRTSDEGMQFLFPVAGLLPWVEFALLALTELNADFALGLTDSATGLQLTLAFVDEATMSARMEPIVACFRASQVAA